MVAYLEVRGMGPDLLHDTGSLMTAGHGKHCGAEIPRGQVVVGVAQARRHHSDQELVLSGIVQLQLHGLVPAR